MYRVAFLQDKRSTYIMFRNSVFSDACVLVKLSLNRVRAVGSRAGACRASRGWRLGGLWLPPLSLLAASPVPSFRCTSSPCRSVGLAARSVSGEVVLSVGGHGWLAVRSPPRVSVPGSARCWSCRVFPGPSGAGRAPGVAVCGSATRWTSGASQCCEALTYVRVCWNLWGLFFRFCHV